MRVITLNPARASASTTVVIQPLECRKKLTGCSSAAADTQFPGCETEKPVCL